jgi:O-antigen/teichoic acid export membrane protein
LSTTEQIQEVDIKNNKAELTTKGMTSKVVKGSLWVFAGQILPLIATFIASPFVIRYLGTEAYGVLLIVAMVPSYFGFTSFGMGLASTKFGAEAYGNNDAAKEADVIRTAGYITFWPTLIVTCIIILLAEIIVTDIFKIPSKYQVVATTGLRMTSIAFLFSTLTSVVNTPQLTRLKMGLNVLCNAIPRTLMTLLAPVVVYYGGGIIGSTLLACITAIVIFILNLIISGKLLPSLYKLSIDKKLFQSLIQFGKGMILYDIAVMVVVNMEKFLLPAITGDPKQTAYFSIAATLANMTSMFTLAVGQTLIPAFSQMLAPEKKEALNALFARTFKGCLFVLMPVCIFLIVIAKPFLWLWAGQEFGIHSAPPFYILMGGVFFSLLMFIPNSILLANGRTSLFGKLYAIEVVPYLLLTFLLIRQFGIFGAAFAWSLREFTNTIVFYFFSKKYTGISYKFNIHPFYMGVAIIILALPIVFVKMGSDFSIWNIPVFIGCTALYFLIVWHFIITSYERLVLTNKFNDLLKTIRLR